MDPREFLERAIVNTYDFLMDRFGQPLVQKPIPPSRPAPNSSMDGIPFGPYQGLINRAGEVVRDLNKQTEEKEKFIRELGGY